MSHASPSVGSRATARSPASMASFALPRSRATRDAFFSSANVLTGTSLAAGSTAVAATGSAAVGGTGEAAGDGSAMATAGAGVLSAAAAAGPGEAGPGAETGSGAAGLAAITAAATDLDGASDAPEASAWLRP